MADGSSARAGLGSDLSRRLQSLGWILYLQESDQRARDEGISGS
jgi:hypothetical protein